MISVPEDSPHEHPHEDALEIYKEYVEETKILYTCDGTLVLTLHEDGQMFLEVDESIQDDYELSEDSDEDGDGGNGKAGQKSESALTKTFGIVTGSRTRLVDRPAALDVTL